MEAESARERTLRATRARILDAALTVLGQDPDAGMGEIATAAGVVRRTVYAHFPARADLVRDLARQAGEELVVIVDQLDDGRARPDRVWADYVRLLWPLAARYRALLLLRRGEHGDDIHRLLAASDTRLAGLVERGQADDTFGSHLPPDVLSQLAQTTVFTLAHDARTREGLDAAAAMTTSLLLMGVTRTRIGSLVRARG